jgi:RHS repeat-associated protein
MINNSSSFKTLARAVMAVVCAAASLTCLAQTDSARNGLSVSIPNGYANIKVEDLRVMSTAGPVIWSRTWDGTEWKINPHWESLSQSWRNLTGNQAIDTLDGTITRDPSQTTSTSGPTRSTALLSASGGMEGCYVWVDEDWQPSGQTVGVIGGATVPQMIPERVAPFNRMMGEPGSDYPPPMMLNVDWVNLCPGGGLSAGPTVQDFEGLRRASELYLGSDGRFSFNSRSVIEKRAVRQLPRLPAGSYGSLGAGQMSVAPVTLANGYRWIDKGGDWIDYSNRGQMVAWGDRNNNVVWLQRDTDGILRGVVDASGHVAYTLHYTGALVTEVRDYPVAGNALDLPPRSVKYAYDAANRLTKVTDARGFDTLYEYDASNRVSRVTDQESHAEQVAYKGEVVSQRVAPDGAVTDYTFDYDASNRQLISKITSPATVAGRMVTDYTHNRAGKLVRRIVNGRTDEEVKYDTAARAQIRTNARGFATRITQSEFGQVIEVALPDGSFLKRQHSAAHLRMIESTDELGVRTTYAHDTRGNLIQKTEAFGTPDERVTTYVRNGLGQISELTRKGRTEANGAVTLDAIWKFDYDDLGEIKQTTDPENNVRLYVIDRAGNLVRYTDPLNHATRYEVDAHGNLIRSTDPLGHVRSFVYDKVGNLTSETDARLKTTLMAYDAMNRNHQVTNPVSGVYRVQFNGQGVTIAQTDEDGRRSDAEYDNWQRLTRVIDGKGNATEHGYQLADGSNSGILGSLTLPTQTKYPTFNEQQRYDELERPTTRTLLNPTPLGIEGLINTNKYDRRGMVVESTDAEGKTSFFSYDALGRTSRFTNSMGQSIDLSWDVRDNLIEVKNAKGKVTRFEYDRADRLVKETLPLGQVTLYTYDAKGNRDTITDAAGNRMRYVFDTADRPERSEVTTAGQATPGLIYTFTHDEEDNLKTWSDGTRSASFTYDDANRLLSATLSYGNGVTLPFGVTYTAAGYVNSLTYPDSTRIGFAFDAHGKLGSVDIPGEGSISVTAWNWLAPKTLTLPGGTTHEASHDGLLKLTGLKVKNPGQQTVFEIANQYGKRDEIKTKSLTDTAGLASATVSHQYGYDDELRLTLASRDAGGISGQSSETFSHDAAGNRVTHSAVSGTLVYDDNDRLRQRGSGAGAITYDYDANGNLSLKTEGSSGTANTITRYRYDALNRLVRVEDGAGAPIAEYAYDPFDNRLVKDRWRDDSGTALASPRRTHYLYAQAGLIAEADSAGNVTAQYGWNPHGEWGTDPIFIKTDIKEGAGNTATGYAYFHNDHLGTPQRATDKAGRVVWRAEYSSFGQALPAVDNALRNDLRLAGQLFDAETGLHYNTRRYYDPLTGRYITADPIGIDGGWNLYEYASGNPTNVMDPTGEWGFLIPLGAAAWRLYEAYTLYTTVTDIIEKGCVDVMSLIPIPGLKHLGKLARRCRTACGCGLGGGGRHSFPGDTPVHAQDEHGQTVLVPISALKVGDKVLAKSEWKADGQSLSYEPVTDVFATVNQQRTLVHLRLDNGQELTATDGHPFRTTDGWRDAVLLKRGGKLLLRGEGESDAERVVAIEEVRQSSETLTTYNLEVANAHTFFVGAEGALVHNGNCHREHEHHMVRQKAPSNWRQEYQDYVFGAQDILRNSNIGMHDDRNLSRASNGRGVHSAAEARYVYERLEAAERRGGPAAVEKTLEKMRKEYAGGFCLCRKR